jgi:hypothetical protein
MQHAAPDRSEMDPEVCENNDETDPFGKWNQPIHTLHSLITHV